MPWLQKLKCFSIVYNIPSKFFYDDFSMIYDFMVFSWYLIYDFLWYALNSYEFIAKRIIFSIFRKSFLVAAQSTLELPPLFQKTPYFMFRFNKNYNNLEIICYLVKTKTVYQKKFSQKSFCFFQNIFPRQKFACLSNIIGPKIL